MSELRAWWMAFTLGLLAALGFAADYRAIDDQKAHGLMEPHGEKAHGLMEPSGEKAHGLMEPNG